MPESHDENEAGRATHSGRKRWSPSPSGGFQRVLMDPLTLKTEAVAAGSCPSEMAMYCGWQGGDDEDQWESSSSEREWELVNTGR